MKWAFATLALSFVSALFPMVNAEGYLALAATRSSGSLVGVVGIAAVAAAGQMSGKLVWYYAAANALRIPVLNRKMRKPAWQERLARLERRASGSRLRTTTFLFISAVVGLPPYALAATLAGLVRFSIFHFLVSGLLGRFIRFFAIMEFAAWAWLFSH